MEREQAINLIAGRIADEFRKHNKLNEWPEIAAKKLYDQWSEYFALYPPVSNTEELREQLKFGDYCLIEQHRFGADNEFYQHKVIGTLKSNTYVDVPVTGCIEEKIHDESVEVVRCICCGVSEKDVFTYRLADVKKMVKSLPVTGDKDAFEIKLPRNVMLDLQQLVENSMETGNKEWDANMKKVFLHLRNKLW